MITGFTSDLNFESNGTSATYKTFDSTNKCKEEDKFMEIATNIEFKWKNISAKITLENGYDLIKMSMLLSELLSSNGIPNKLDITSNNQ